MGGGREEFFDKYDLMMPRYCKPYSSFLKTGAENVPKTAKSIYDLGIGTGNFSEAVKNRLPDIKIYGIDLDAKQLQKAQEKLDNAELYLGEIFSKPFPKSDCIISSLMTHHFDSRTRKEKLIAIAGSSPLFINFDMFLFPGYDLNKTIMKISEFTEKNFLPEQVKEIEKEMLERDNPMPLEEVVELFNSKEFNFKIVAEDMPYIIYTVSLRNKFE